MASRRGFLGGVGALVAAAAYSRDVPAADAETVANGDDSLATLPFTPL